MIGVVLVALEAALKIGVVFFLIFRKENEID